MFALLLFRWLSLCCSRCVFRSCRLQGVGSLLLTTKGDNRERKLLASFSEYDANTSAPYCPPSESPGVPFSPPLFFPGLSSANQHSSPPFCFFPFPPAASGDPPFVYAVPVCPGTHGWPITGVYSQKVVRGLGEVRRSCLGEEDFATLTIFNNLLSETPRWVSAGGSQVAKGS